VRRPGSKKGPTVGSGGWGKKALEGKGPTPKAVDRPYHPAAKKAAAAAKRAPTGKASGAKRAAREKAQGEYVIGRNPVLEALQADVPATQLLVANGIEPDQRVRQALQLAGERGLAIQALNRSDLERRIGLPGHQGVALKVAGYDYAHPGDLWRLALDAAQVPLIVALDGVTDPHNLGAVLRSAGAFGAHGVVLPARRSAQMGPVAWKVSAGAAARVPVARATNLVRTLTEYQDNGAFVVGLDAQADIELADLPVPDSPLVWVVGSEVKGLARLTRQACDAIVSIPIAAASESLNAAVAAGIALYQIDQLRRQ
jgi:23S rRNA (guanosine2251-2'-O)-methyltransferase